MARKYRYHCGRCRYRTSWLSEFSAADRQWQHYARRHPGITASGRLESRNARMRDGAGCLALVFLSLLLLLFAASCHHGTASTPVSKTAGARAELSVR
jgi:hypothetical protein